MQILTNLGTTTDYINKAIYEVSESEGKTKIDEETMKKSRKEMI
jgi:gentisate 1,2-dioxygenase